MSQNWHSVFKVTKLLILPDISGEACELLAQEFGDKAPECAEAYFYYGKALLEAARLEAGVLGNIDTDDSEEKSEDDEDDEEQGGDTEEGVFNPDDHAADKENNQEEGGEASTRQSLRTKLVKNDQRLKKKPQTDTGEVKVIWGPRILSPKDQEDNSNGLHTPKTSRRSVRKLTSNTFTPRPVSISGDYRVKCEYCGKRLLKKSMQYHLKKIHLDKLLECRKCGSKFLREAAREIHEKSCVIDYYSLS